MKRGDWIVVAAALVCAGVVLGLLIFLAVSENGLQ